MLFMDLAREYREYCDKYKAVWRYLEGISLPFDDVVSDICRLRGYTSRGRWKALLREVGVVFIPSGSDLSSFNVANFSELGLFTSEGKFLLEGRYILPVRDMLGSIIALIGWYPDSKKYITTPSRFFSKDCLYFGMEQFSSFGIGCGCFVVEGIFDCLALRSLGYMALACMGISSSVVKGSYYGLLGRVVAIPDNDTLGKKVIRYDEWNLPSNGFYFRWSGEYVYDGVGSPVKDIDRLCNLYDESDLVELFDSLMVKKITSKVESIEL